jgi:hypothetical protein
MKAWLSLRQTKKQYLTQMKKALPVSVEIKC